MFLCLNVILQKFQRMLQLIVPPLLASFHWVTLTLFNIVSVIAVNICCIFLSTGAPWDPPTEGCTLKPLCAVAPPVCGGLSPVLHSHHQLWVHTRRVRSLCHQGLDSTRPKNCYGRISHRNWKTYLSVLKCREFTYDQIQRVLWKKGKYVMYLKEHCQWRISWRSSRGSIQCS